MGHVTFVLSDGSRIDCEIPEGTSLAGYCRQNGVPGILADCGCNLACATCHVYVQRDWLGRLPAPSAAERDMLEGTGAPATERSRLGCQIVMTASLDGLTVEVPAEQ